MTPLGARIARQIQATGPISVSDYMAMCLFDPADGYYTTREPFGEHGDFTTAPEISQMFGELIAIWLYQTWDALGRPTPLTVAEIGPGRGTLMKDMLRTFERLDPSFTGAITVALIETSPQLTEVQKATLSQTKATPSWHTTIETLPDAPLLIVGNELFDAIPIRQFVRTESGWRERMVALDSQGQLAFFSGAGSLDPSLLPADACNAASGAIVELAPARTAMMTAIAVHIAAKGGAALFPDYGYTAPGVADTLQAVRRHRYENVLANPGEADLTAHVDFAALAAAANNQKLSTHLTTQGEFLLAMGLLERAGSLGAHADETGRDEIRAAVERLAAPQGMGELFKILAVSPPGVSLPHIRSVN
ncbi:class I SAM-dependent methyltransferase [Manganibacter manganicus]|uniref:Methyltransferase n=1 Tax=Manganibacter manganicus TaxID=1873176 RepID=A0A1V8RV31_9HYPH|nr:class I SAM-dependent methyltransferase [Pseudaminobacter manganicus]OQM76869.1 methyltransferase [Pseudaminobacter manganicus]